MAELRFAVIGYGNMGRFHADYLSKGTISGSALTAIVDTNPKIIDEALLKHPTVQTFTSADQLFDAKVVDAVIVATPHYFHPPIAIAALKSGLHALVEKPAGVYTRQVREMNAVASQSGRVFAIMFNQRTNGAHQKMRDLVSSGEIGEIKRVLYVITDWTRTQSYYDSGGWRATWAGEGGGVLLNQSPHNLDLLQWITGMPKRVRAFCSFGKYHSIEVEDDVTAYLEYENGASGVFITTTGEAPGSKIFEIAGDRGKLVLSNDHLTFHRTAQSVSEFIKTCPDGFAQPETWTCDIPFKGGDEHIGITRNFVSAILDGKPLIASGQEGINGATLANAMLLSSWTDNWVSVPFDDDLYYNALQERIAKSTIQKDGNVQQILSVSGTF